MDITQLTNNAAINLTIGLLSFAWTIFKAFKFVQEGELGVKLRFGRVVRKRDGSPKIISPGFALLIPWVDSLIRRHVRQQIIVLKHQEVQLRDKLIYQISAMVTFRVVDVYKALFDISKLEESLEHLAQGILRDVLRDYDHATVSDTPAISKALLEQLEAHAGHWGVNFISFRIADCRPSPESASYVIAETGVLLRLNALESALATKNISIGKIDPSLAATLIGIPLIASVQSKGDNIGDALKEIARDQGKNTEPEPQVGFMDAFAWSKSGSSLK